MMIHNMMEKEKMTVSEKTPCNSPHPVLLFALRKLG